MVRKFSLVAGLVLVAAVPLAAQASGGVSVAVSTPEFGFRIGGPFYGPRLYAPVPVAVPAPVYPPVVYAPPPVVYAPAPIVFPAPRVFYPAPVFVPPPRVVYRHGYVPPPRIIVPYGYRRQHEHAYEGQYAGYRIPPGHANRYSHSDRYQ
jgi:hypothetical protein